MSTLLREKDNGKTINASVGSAIKIELEGNPSTGYSWFREGHHDVYFGEEMSDDLFRVTSEYTQTQQTIGGGGTFRFKVIPKVPGTHVLKLLYARTFEAITDSNEGFRVTLVVK